jgi:hypothetical protein
MSIFQPMVHTEDMMTSLDRPPSPDSEDERLPTKAITRSKPKRKQRTMQDRSSSANGKSKVASDMPSAASDMKKHVASTTGRSPKWQ